MAEEKFRLPRSSYDQVARIIQGYANFAEGARLAEVAKVAGTESEIVSRNNGFLQDIGVLTGGTKKALTDVGPDLARALEYDKHEDIERLWREIISNTDFLRSVLSAVRIRRGMDQATLQTHIAYSAGLPKNQRVMTGAASVIEILQLAGLLRDEEGRLVAVPAEDVESRDVSAVATLPYESSAPPRPETPEPTLTTRTVNVDTSVQIQVRVQCSPSELDEVGEKLRILLDELARPSQE